MVGKPNKKKKVLSAHERVDSVTEVDVSSFDLTDLPTEFVELLDGLSAETSCQGQIKLLQSHKRKLKALLTSNDLVVETRTRIITILLHLFLYPKYAAFQIALEWIASCLLEIKNANTLDITGILSDVGCAIWKEAEVEFASSSVTVAILLQWLKALSSLALFDRDIQWLSNPSGTQNSETTLDVISFVSLLGKVLQISSQKLLSNNTTVVASSSLSAPEFIQWGTCCTQCLRDLVTILRPLKAKLSEFYNVIAWQTFLTSISSISLQLLLDEQTPKDALTGAGSIVLIVLHVQVASVSLPSMLQSLVEAMSTDLQTTLTTPLTSIGQALLTNAPQFSSLARCAVLRSLLTVCDLDAFPPVFFFQTILNAILMHCSTGHSFTQLYGLQTLETWINKLAEFQKQQEASFYDVVIAPQQAIIVPQIVQIGKILCLSWGHPSRQISHIVIDLYQVYIKTVLKIWPNNANANQSIVWNAIIQEVMQMPNFHRGKYQAMKILMDYLGIPYFLALQPTIVTLLLQNMKERDIAASISTLLPVMIKYFINQDTAQRSYAWEEELIAALSCDDCEILRQNIADYLLPEICKISSQQVVNLLKYSILPLLPILTSSNSNDNDSNTTKAAESLSYGRLWCIIQILLNGKLVGHSIDVAIVFESLSTTTTTVVTLDQLLSLFQQVFQSSILHYQDSLRLAALLTLVVSLKSSQPLLRKDYELLMPALSYSLKTADIDECSKINRVLKHLLVRLKSNLKGSLSSDVTMQGIMSLQEVIRWLLSIFKAHFLPGIPFDREYALLNVLVQCLDVLYDTSTTPNTPIATLETMKASIDLMLQQEIDASFIQILCNGFLSNWDKSRKAVTSILLKLPMKPWPGYEQETSLLAMIGWGKRLAESARLRESDAGAQILTSIFSVYCMELGWSIDSLQSNKDSVFEETISTQELTLLPIREQSCAKFLHYLYTTLDKILMNLENIFVSLMQGNAKELMSAGNSNSSECSALSLLNEQDEFPLAHGLLLTIKLCLVSLSKKGLLKQEATNAIWSKVMQQLLVLTTKGLNIAMNIVAEAKSDVPFAPAPSSSSSASTAINSEEEEQAVGFKGPIDSPYSMVASYVNTNSFMSSVDDSKSNSATTDSASSDMMEQVGMKAQRAVVAAWLLVKESTALLSTLVEISPVPPAPTSTPVSTNAMILLQNKDIEQIGTLLLDALGRLKHMGAIAEAHVALQAIATVLLRYGEKNLYLSDLPKQWLTALLQRLYQHQQVFILRRSAGFAYSFLSLLRAEPANSTPILLHQAMTSLLEIVEEGIVKPTEALTNNQQAEVQDIVIVDNEEPWKLSVHALNVLRLILLDGAFGQDLDQYIAKTLSFAVIGFASNQWSVRNSSMMVFSATIQRTISREKNDSGGIQSVTADEYFRHYPALFPFLQTKLHHIVKITMQQLQEKQPQTGQEANQIVVQGKEEKIEQENSLYPLLLLFAKFRAALLPSMTVGSNNKTLESVDCVEGNSKTSLEFNYSLLLQDMQQCITHETAMIRQVAARAFSALIPIQDTPKLLTTLTTNLLTKLNTLGKSYAINHLQGEFLLLKEIITQIWKLYQQSYNMNSYFFQTLQTSLVKEVLPVYFAVLERLLVVFGDKTLVLSPVVLLAFQMHEILVQLLQDVTMDGIIQTLHTKWLVLAQTMVQSNYLHLTQYAQYPYVGLMMKACIQYLCTWELEAQLENLYDYVLHPVSEVREGVIRGIGAFIQRAGKSLSKDLLLVLLLPIVEAVAVEPQPHILIHYVQVLYSMIVSQGLSPVEVLHAFQGTNLNLWKVLLSRIYSTTPSSSSSSSSTSSVLCLQSSTPVVIEIYSYLMQDFTTLSSSSCQAWLQIVSLAAQEDQPYDYRLAAAKGIVASQFLPSFYRQYTSSSSSSSTNTSNVLFFQSADCLPIVLDLLLLCVELLQDDDDDVRMVISAHVCELLAILQTQSCTTVQYTTVTHTLEQIPTLFQSFLYFAITQFPSNVTIHEECIQTLINKWQFVTKAKQVQCEWQQQQVGSNGKNIPRKIFEAEQANLFIEPVKYAEILMVIIIQAGKQHVSLQSIVQQMVQMVGEEVFAGIQSILTANTVVKVDGIYDADLFGYVYSALLFLHTFQKDRENENAYEHAILDQIDNDEAKLRVFHPLIRSLLKELNVNKVVV